MIKTKLANDVAEFIKIGKEQQKQVLSEPDPEEKEQTPELQQQTEEKIITDSLYNAVIKSQYDLENNGQFNVQLSGSTLTSAFFSGNQLFTANSGDSRVILVSADESDGTKKIKYKQLTTDHKPETAHEKQRICSRGGKVL